MLTTYDLTKIQPNDGLKYHNISFGIGAGHHSLDEYIFLAKSSLSKSLFLQAYHNWLTIIYVISCPEVAVAWYKHYSKVLQDQKLSASLKCGMTWTNSFIPSLLTTFLSWTPLTLLSHSFLNGLGWTPF